MHKSFWKKWSTEYLHHLQTRSKWNHGKPKININDIVLVNEDNMPPSKWALGKITNLHAGKDGYVRVVTLKTKNGFLKRPIIKLTPLPVRQENDIALDKSNDMKNDRNCNQNQYRNTRSRKRPNFYVAVIMLLLTLIAPSLQQSFKITRLNTSNTLYFDKIADMRIVQDQWKMIVYYNMTKYWQSMTDIENYINHLKNITSNENLFKPIISQFDHEMNEIIFYNELLQTNTQLRVKRGLINGIGNIANTLFGVLDDKFAERYERDIMTIRTNENHLLKMLKNQTSVLEAENNILRRNENIMNNHFQFINGHLKNISMDIGEVRKATSYQFELFNMMTTALSADVILSNLRRIQETLIDTITNIHHGQIDMHLISPEEMQNQINLISGQLHGETVLPADNRKDLYQLLQVSTKVTKSFLIMEIKIPLLSQNEFELNKIISLPWTKKNRNIYNIPITPYIAINMKRDMLMPMHENDIQACKQYQDNNKLMCYESTPILNIHFDKSICATYLYNNDNDTFCRMEFKQCSDKWIKLQAPGAWLYSCCRECRIRILCPAGVETKQLQGNGLINIGQGCFIKGDNWAIQAHRDYTNQMLLHKDIDIPSLGSSSSLNDVINSSYAYNTMTDNYLEKHDELYESIRQQIETLKTQDLQQIQASGTTHDTIIYSILSLIIMFITCYAIVKTWRRYTSGERQRSSSQDQREQRNRPADLETGRIRDSVVSGVSDDHGIRDRNVDVSMCRDASGSVLNVEGAASPTIKKTIKFDNLPQP